MLVDASDTSIKIFIEFGDRSTSRYMFPQQMDRIHKVSRIINR